MERVARKITVASVLVLLFAALTSWSVAAEPIVITHLGFIWHGDAWHDHMNQKIAEFEALNPDIKIERIIGGKPGEGSMEEKYASMIAGGVAPDVVEMTLSQAGGMAPKGVFMDLRPFVKRDGVKLEKYAQTAIKALTWTDGTLWGFPLDVYPVTTIYNADLFAEAGLRNPTEVGEAGWTWDYAMEAARKISKDTNGDKENDIYGIDNVWQMVQYGVPVKQAGGSLYDRYVNPTKTTLVNDSVVKAFEWTAEFIERKVNAPNYDVTMVNGVSGFNLTTGPTAIQILGSNAKFKWGLASPTMGPDNNGSYVATNGLQMSSYTKHADAAWKWIKFLATDEENIKDLVKATARIPAYVPLIAQYPKLIGSDAPGLTSYSDIVLNPKSFHPAVGPDAFSMDVAIQGSFYEKVVTGEKPVRIFLQELSEELDAKIEETNAKFK